METGGKLLATILIVALWLVISIFLSAAGVGAVLIIPLFLGMVYGVKAIWKKEANGNSGNGNDIEKHEDSDSSILQK